MFRTTIRADETTDVEAVISDLRNQCSRASVSPIASDLIFTQARNVLTELVERGRQLAAQGSQITVTREVEADGIAVKLVFRANVRRSFFERLVNAFRGR